MPKISYEVVSTQIKPYTYSRPLVGVDENGELFVEYSKHGLTHIKNVVLLFLVGRDESGVLVSEEPLEHANRFILSHHIDDRKEESEQYSKGLIHFFSFLITMQARWDTCHDEDLYDEAIDLPRPTWDNFPIRKSERITYQYRKALFDAVLNEPDQDKRLARTTATAYMGAVIKFYKFHLRNGYPFVNPPFEHEVITLHFEANGRSMNGYMSKEIHTTDLRLNFPKSQKNEGGSLPSAKRGLKPLTNNEWKEVENILINTRRVVKNIGGELKSATIPIEFCLLFLIIRYSGMRKEEASSLHKGQVVKPDLTKPNTRIGIGGQYGSLTKTKDGGNKSRRTIIKSSIMQMLYEYTRSDRYKQRLAKFQKLCQTTRDNGEDGFFDAEDGVDEDKHYLFISQSGKPIFTKLNEINTRWNEIRTTVEKVTGKKVIGTVHNLRATFGVSLFRVLLREMTTDEALAHVSECFGHEDESTTLMYLTIAQDYPTGDEIYEDVLEHLKVFDEPNELDTQLSN
ncbi:site-specific integrase [Pseudoalteromonas sp. Isolate3]|uniref:site-specific integrase n=1 Tax=Pseudoalteromonas sp. Isolate3 TaxID=2908526 RepID=UPI001EFDBFAD|nr:site-specific integrase [Pseudoalteromonas sp. Isolate3]MCG9707413.1 site-specific integrase [Pseudoalteromonas sp. Isolate3]